jgi:hypothetical protein
MTDTQLQIFNGTVTIICFVAGFLLARYDVFGRIWRFFKKKKKKNFCEEVKGMSPPKDDAKPNGGR